MYKTYPSLVLGFHACDESIAKRVFSGKARLKSSKNNYDWLGHGVYFWENSPDRAMQWGEMQKSRGRITKPCVVGAVIALGRCFDLLDAHALSALRRNYHDMALLYKKAGIENQMPKNGSLPGGEDLLIRELDCAVIEYTHSQDEEEYKKDRRLRPFDSVRSAFWEGKELYRGAGFKEKNHIQICVRNHNCIKGYFRPLALVEKYPAV